MTTPGRAILAALEAFSVGAAPPKGGGRFLPPCESARRHQANTYWLAAYDGRPNLALRAYALGCSLTLTSNRLTGPRISKNI